MGYVSRSVTGTQILAALSADGNKLEQPTAMLDFWSVPTLGAAPIAITSTAGDKTLPDVTLPNLSGLSVEAAYAMFYISRILCSGSTVLASESYIQVDKAAAGYIDSIMMGQHSIGRPAAGEPRVVGYRMVGHIDISSRVAFNATTNFKWLVAEVDSSTFTLYGVCTGVRVIVS